LIHESSTLFIKCQAELKKVQNNEGLNLDGLEKDSPQFKEAQRKVRQYKTLMENFMKIKTDFDESGAAIIEKQKMYIENAKKSGTNKPGAGKSGNAAAK
jgi:hypothetical protein